MSKQIWDIWPEPRVTNEAGTTYIKTPDDKWFIYLGIWVRSLQENTDTKCPCPMPFGHIMFDNVKAPPPKTQNQMELF
jgi:hypothetical protein